MIALLFTLALFSTVYSQNSNGSVYYQYHDSRFCGTCDQVTEYPIGACFQTENDVGMTEWANAVWIVEGVSVRLSFFGNDATCTTSTGTWEYTLDQCVSYGHMSELVSATPCERVFYQFYDTSNCNDCVDEETLYVVGNCFETTNDNGGWEYAMASWVSQEQGTIDLSFYGQDSTCTTPTGSWSYTVDTCRLNGDWGSELVSSTQTNNFCSYGLSVFWIMFIIILSLTVAICVCKTCQRRRRVRQQHYQPVAATQQQQYQPAQPVQQKPVVYAQQPVMQQPPVYAQPPVYQQPVYAQPPQYAPPQQQVHQGQVYAQNAY